MSLHRPLVPEGRGVSIEAPASAPCAVAARPFVLAATIAASAMAFIDGSVVTIALPTLQAELGAGFGAMQWVVNAYTLFLGALILVGGAAGDRFGRRRLFLWGIVIFAAASAGCALAPGVGTLIAARGLQGVGAALMVPQSLAIIAASFPPEIRGRAIGTWAGASAIATALGPAVGGALIDAFGWRAAFWINLPLAAVVVVLALRFVPESRSDGAGPLDWAGTALAVASAALLTLGLSALAEPDAPLLRAGALAAAGLVAAAAFVAIERRVAAPLVPLGLFASRAFTGANLTTLFLYGALGGMLFLLPFELVGRRGMSSAEVGLVFLPLGFVIGLFARRAGLLGDRIGVRPMLVAGSAVVAIAGLVFAAAPPGLAGALAPVVLLAAGMALVVAPLTTAVMNAAPDALAGAASGLSNAASRLAGLFAVALVGAIAALVFGEPAPGARFGTFAPAAGPEALAVAGAFGRAYAAGMLTCAALAALAALTARMALPGRTGEAPARQ